MAGYERFGIDANGIDDAPMGYQGPPMPVPTIREDAARQNAKKRLLAALAGGLANPNRGGGFLGGLASGFSGSVGSAMAFDQQRSQEVRDQEKAEAEARRQAFRDALDAKRYGLDEQRLGLEGRRVDLEGKRLSKQDGPSVGAVPWYESLPDTDPRKSQYRAAELRPPEPRDKLIQVMGPNGRPIFVPESQAAGMEAPRDRSTIKGQERTALAFYNRAKEAENTIGGLEDKISKMSTTDQFRLRFAPNILQTQDQQIYRQAQRAFTEARLRKESGAAIPTSEYENDSKTYFAQPGDSPETIRKKAAARRVVLNGLKFQSGAAYEEYYGEPNTPPGRGNTVEDLGAKYGF